MAIIGVYSFTGCIAMFVCCLTLQYIILVSIILLAEIAGAILAFVFEAEVCTIIDNILSMAQLTLSILVMSCFYKKIYRNHFQNCFDLILHNKL